MCCIIYADYRYMHIYGAAKCLNCSFSVHVSRRHIRYFDHALSVIRPSSLTFRIFDFSSETTEQNSTKHDTEQDLSILYQVCVFFLGGGGGGGASEKQDGRPASDWLRPFAISPLKSLNRIQRSLTRSSIWHPKPSLCFFGPIGKPIWLPGLIGWDIFDFSS